MELAESASGVPILGSDQATVDWGMFPIPPQGRQRKQGRRIVAEGRATAKRQLYEPLLVTRLAMGNARLLLARQSAAAVGGEEVAVFEFWVVLRPGFMERGGADQAGLICVEPKRPVSAPLPVAVGRLGRRLPQPPGDDTKRRFLGVPLPKNHLIKYLTALRIVKVVQFDDVGSVEGNQFVRHKRECRDREERIHGLTDF